MLLSVRNSSPGLINQLYYVYPDEYLGRLLNETFQLLKDDIVTVGWSEPEDTRIDEVASTLIYLVPSL